MSTPAILYTPHSRRLLAMQKQYALSAQQMYNAGALLAHYKAIALPSGNLQVESLSRSGLFHQVNPRHESCTCEHAKKGAMCFHLAVWIYLRQLPPQERFSYNYIAKAQQVYERAAAQIHRNENPIAQREQVKKLERSARPKTEWAEELDQ